MSRTDKLPPAKLPLTGAELIELSQNGAPKKVAVSEVGGSGAAVWGTITGTITDQADLTAYITGFGYITGINSGMVTTALGYTPYDAANPAGYITASSANTLTNKTWNGNVIAAIYGGTGWGSYTPGDMLYAYDASTLAKLPKGTNGEVLTMVSGVPGWAAAAGGGWGLTGNAGTTAGTNFIGTTDDVDFVIKRNSISLFTIKPTSIFYGFNAGFGVSSIANSIFFGSYAGRNATSAVGALFFGVGAGDGATYAARSNFFGDSAGLNASGAADSNFFGQQAGSGATNASFSNFFGYTAGKNASNASNSIFFGNAAGSGATSANRSNFFGQSAGLNSTGANGSNFFGQQAGWAATNARFSNFFGFNAGQGGTGAANSNFFGFNVGSSGTHAITGANNILIGTNITTPAASSANTMNLGGVLFGTNFYGTTTGNPSKVAQANGQIGINVETPHQSSALEIKSIIGGFLPPRMTTTQRTAIATPAEGLIVYDITLHKLYLFTTAWEQITSV